MKQFVFILATLVTSLAVNAQSHYYMSYEDLRDGNGYPLDTLIVKPMGHGKQKQGSNSFILKTNNKQADKTLRFGAFAVMQDDTLYVNCMNLRCQKASFGEYYAKGIRIGEHSLLIVNRLVTHRGDKDVSAAAFMFGLVGAAVAAAADSGSSKQLQVCYLISWGADKKGRTEVRLVDETLIDQMLKGHYDLLEEFLSEPDENLRIQASRVVPLLERAGLFKSNNL